MVYKEPVGEFGKWLADRIDERNMTNYQVSDLMGIGIWAISYHLHEKKLPSYKTVKKYCAIFEVEDYFEVYEMVMRDRKSQENQSL